MNGNQRHPGGSSLETHFRSGGRCSPFHLVQLSSRAAADPQGGPDDRRTSERHAGPPV